MIARCLHTGSRLPNANVSIVSWNDGQYTVDSNVSAHGYFLGKKVLLLGLQGAFLPSSTRLLQAYLEYAASDEFFLSKLDWLVVHSTNDAYVVQRFAQQMKGLVTFVADGNGTFARELGLAELKPKVVVPNYLALMSDGMIETYTAVSEGTVYDAAVRLSNELE